MEASMIEKGSQVAIHYTLTVDGEVVDSSEGKDPLTYEQGAGHIIPGLESELAGLKAGDKKLVTVAPEGGYGVHTPEAIQEVPRSAFPTEEELKVGDRVSGEADGQMFQATVQAFGDETITLDFNHPLAGKTLNFDVTVVSVS